MALTLRPKQKAEQLYKTFGDKAITVVNQILKYSPNKPNLEFEPLDYFREVKKHLKEMK